jgi:hypothetical protein
MLCAVAVVAIGLGTRRFGTYIPEFVAQYAGDTLWALTVFLGLGIVAPRTPTLHRAILSLVVSYLVEFAQLYHAPWIDSLRNTTLGGLVLGFGFLWSDLLCYTVGVVVGAAIDAVVRRSASPPKNRTTTNV